MSRRASAGRRRAHTEEFARDSFENLLFSLCRHRELTGGYPQRLTVVSLPFKRERSSRAQKAAAMQLEPVARRLWHARGAGPTASHDAWLREPAFGARAPVVAG